MDKQQTKNSIVFDLLKTVLFSYMVTTVLLFLLAFAVFKLKWNEKSTWISLYGIYLLSSMVGGYYLGKKREKRRFLWGLLAGGIYELVLLLMAIGVYQTIGSLGRLGMQLGLCLLGGMIGAIVS